jgi:hypothetical protein
LTGLAEAYAHVQGGYYKFGQRSREEYREWTARRARAIEAGDGILAWACSRVLLGVPEPISDFVIEPHYVAVEPDGDRVRMVKLRYRGGNPSGLLPLDHFSGSTPTLFRQWLSKHATGTWMTGERDLQALQSDINYSLEGKEVTLVAAMGFHEESRIWFFDDCAYGPDGPLHQKRDGIYWHKGRGYLIDKLGAEGQPFCQGRPLLQPYRTVLETLGSNDQSDEAALTEFLFNTAHKLNETLGDFHGYVALGWMFAFGATPEIYRRITSFPGLWLHGETRQGKSSLARWLMWIWGFKRDTGKALKNSTSPGLAITLQQYGNLPVWWEEYQTDAGDFVQELIKNVFNRESSVKWLGDSAVQRKILTSVIITGEATSRDAATRSRYLHIQVSASKRQADHYGWFEKNSPNFFLFGRHIMRNRGAFAQAVVAELNDWLESPELANCDGRARMVHGVAWAAMKAAIQLLPSSAWSKPLESYKRFLVARCRTSVGEVAEDVNVEIFLDHLLTAFEAGEFGSSHDELRKYFRLRHGELAFAPGTTTQDSEGVINDRPSVGWVSWTLFINPKLVYNTLLAYLRKQGRSMPITLRDLHAQMSQKAFWVPGKHQQRFGAAGGQSGATHCWAIAVDQYVGKGYSPVSDSELLTSKNGVNEADWVDPRKGPLYNLIDALGDSAT